MAARFRTLAPAPPGGTGPPDRPGDGGKKQPTDKVNVPIETEEDGAENEESQDFLSTLKRYEQFVWDNRDMKYADLATAFNNAIHTDPGLEDSRRKQDRGKPISATGISNLMGRLRSRHTSFSEISAAKKRKTQADQSEPATEWERWILNLSNTLTLPQLVARFNSEVKGNGQLDDRPRSELSFRGPIPGTFGTDMSEEVMRRTRIELQARYRGKVAWQSRVAALQSNTPSGPNDPNPGTSMFAFNPLLPSPAHPLGSNDAFSGSNDHLPSTASLDPPLQGPSVSSTPAQQQDVPYSPFDTLDLPVFSTRNYVYQPHATLSQHSGTVLSKINEDQSLSLAIHEDDLAIVRLREDPSNLTWPEVAEVYNKGKLKAKQRTADTLARRYNMVLRRILGVPQDDFDGAVLRFFQRLESTAIPARSRAIEQAANEDRALNVEQVFAPQDYTHLPMAVLEDIARTRALRFNSSSGYYDLVRLLHEADAELGILPSAPEAINPFAVPDRDFDDIALEARARLLELADRPLGPGAQPIELRFRSTEILSKWDSGELSSYLGRILSSMLGTTDRVDQAMAGRLHDVSRRSIAEFMNAREGHRPPRSKYGSSRFHDLGVNTLRSIAQSYQHPDPTWVKTASGDELRAWLLVKAPSVQADTPLSTEDRQALVDALATNLIASVGELAPYVKPRSAAAGQVYRTWNERAVFPDPRYLEHFQERVTDGFAFHATPNTGLLCAPIAAVDSINAELARRARVQGADDTPPRINLHDLMEALYADYDRNDVAEIRRAEPNLPGQPTEEFQAFLDARLQEFGWHRESPQYAHEIQQLTTRNNFNVTQLSLALEFWHIRGLIPENYALGVVMPGNQSRPYQAYVLNERHPNQPLIWLRNDNAERLFPGALGHYSAFIRGGDRVRELPSMGFHEPDAVRRPSAQVQRFQHEIVGEDRLRLDKMKQLFSERRKRTACEFCLLTGRHLTCDGKQGRKRCDNCKRWSETCRWSGDDHEPGKFYTLAEASAREASGIDHFQRWNAPLHADKEEQLLARFLAGEPTDIDPSKLYIGVFIDKRVSSGPEDGRLGPRFQDLVDRGPVDHHYYDVLLNSGDPSPEAQRPTDQQGAPIQQIQSYMNVFVMKGTNMIPTQTYPGMDPRLAGAVRLLHTWTAPNPVNGPPVHRPEEIHLLTWGIPGLSTDIGAFGSRMPVLAPGQSQGDGLIGFLLDRDAQNGTSLAHKTYLIALVNKQVVDGIAASSIEGVSPTSLIRPHGPFVPHRNKFLIKNKLLDLIDRDAAVKNYHAQVATAQAGAAQMPPPPPPAPKLDLHLKALRHEKWFRGGNLSATTNPSRGALEARNYQRNSHWA